MSDETPTIETQEAAVERPLSLLASERFGQEFHGEIEEPTEVETEVEETVPEEVEAETEEVTISTVQELIEQNEYDPEWFNTLKFPVKVDGTTAEATLSDLVKSYQIGEAAEKRLGDAKAKAKTLTSELAQKSEALEGQFAVVAKMIENAEKLLDQDTSQVDWKRLRADDPAEYSAKKTEIAERRQVLDKMKREAVESWQQSRQTKQAEIQNNLQAHIQSENAKLLEKIPDWKDQQKAEAGKKKVAEYLIKQGFSQEDVMSAADHRLILMSRKAMLYDEQQANSNPARKKVAKVPKVLKPGSPKPKEQITREKLDKLKARLRESGSIDDAFALLRAQRSN